MPKYHIPVLLWEDFEGRFTASLVEWPEPFVAFGEDSKEVLDQISSYITWRYEEESWRPNPDFHDAQLMFTTVAIRPEYLHENRLYPCDEPILIRAVSVLGHQENGILMCSMPQWNIYFHYYDADNAKELVIQHVQNKLQGMMPLAISRFFPPKSVRLEEVILNRPDEEKNVAFLPLIPILKSMAEPLGDAHLRKKFGRAWERDHELADLIHRLSKEKANIMLVGERGVGKTTLLIEAVSHIERERRKKKNIDKFNYGVHIHSFWQTNAARLISGMMYLGQWEERCEEIIQELSEIEGVLCLENLLDLIQTGGLGPESSIAAFFQPFLKHGELRLVVEATPSELDACRRLLPGFSDLFQILHLPAFTREQSLTILDQFVDFKSRQSPMDIATGATELVYRLFHRFMPYQAFPGKAVAFLSDVFNRASRLGQSVISQANILNDFIRQTGLPELFLRDEILLHYEDVVAFFQSKIIGQPLACQVVAHLVTTFKVGLNDPRRPMGVFLFCGPTGVGKTALAHLVSHYFFGHGQDQNRLIRLDMSEYAMSGSAQGLVATPEGEPSELIKKMRQQPFAVVLLDEIEKAAPEIFDVLLSVFDEGRLTDRFGRTTTFTSAVIIMTSNLGTSQSGSLGFGDAPEPTYEREVMSFFRPEFYNRIDAIVPFKALNKSSMYAITEKELSEISQREGLLKMKLKLVWTERVLCHLTEAGFDIKYGARPLQRAIEEHVVVPLAHHLLAFPILHSKTLLMDFKDGKIVFSFDG